MTNLEGGVRNPRTGEVDYAISPPTATQLAQTCDRLRQAQPDWQRQGVEYRVAALQAWKQVLVDQKDTLVEAIATDTGRITESGLEVDGLMSSLDRWCGLAPKVLAASDPKTAAIPFIQIQSQALPYGLVGVISPWNFPLLLSTIDAIPALLAGCAVIVKPSEITPRFIEPLMATIAAVPALAPVFQYIAGAGETGSDLVTQVDLICFTGSVATGKKVALSAAQQFIPAFLELGGNDPAIVLASADVDRTADALLWGAVVNAGQSCLSIERIYVADAIADRFTQSLTQQANQLSLNYPDPHQGQIGPIIAQRQADIIAAQLDDARSQGAVIHCGGEIEPLGGGLWCRPTVLTQTNHAMTVMTEETFGPIMPVMSVASVEEAIALANDTIYGLSAAVFAGTVEEAIAVGQRLEAGAISINDCGLTAFIHEGEKQAFKQSGLGGSRMGAASMQRFLRKQAFLVNPGAIADPWWFQS